MNKFVAFLVVLGAYMLNASFSGWYVGASLKCINAECTVVASSSIGSILVSIIVILFVLLHPRKISTIEEARSAGIWRRFASFLIDLTLVMLTAAPFLVLPILIAEGISTNNFEWSFVREFARVSDTIYILLFVFLALAVWFYYLYRYSCNDQPTFGQYILGYKVASDPDSAYPPNYTARILLSFLGLCVWPLSLFLRMGHPTKKFWWDWASNTKTVRIHT